MSRVLGAPGSPRAGSGLSKESRESEAQPKIWRRLEGWRVGGAQRLCGFTQERCRRSGRGDSWVLEAKGLRELVHGTAVGQGLGRSCGSCHGDLSPQRECAGMERDRGMAELEGPHGNVTPELWQEV